MTNTRRKHGRSGESLTARLLAEPVHLLGCPSLVVTRGWAYAYYKNLGYSTDSRNGFASADYMAFGTRTSVEPLTALHVVERITNQIAQMEAR